MIPLPTTLILGLILVCSAQYSENDFNCPEECGLFSEGDLIGPTLHNNCEALKENPECKEMFVEKKEKKKKKKKRRRKSDTRIVGGVQSKSPMPWMVLIYIEGSQCGGTLINSQFVLTAAHCFCTEITRCTRTIGGTVVEGEPIKIQESFNVSETKVFIGLTDKRRIEVSAAVIRDHQNEDITYRAQKIFIQPLLGTAEDFKMTPDIALIKLDRPVKMFNSTVRPICLASPGVLERPLCPDMSKDRDATQEERKNGSVHDKARNKMLGGCATVAGWGNRYSKDEMSDNDSKCVTDFSDTSPDKLSHCLPYWTSHDGEEMENCTKKDFHPDDITRPCALFAKELLFNKELHYRLGTNASTHRYNLLDINDLVGKQKAPMEIVIKTKSGKKIVFHCGKTKFSSEEREKMNGWCATKLDKRDKIQRWGYCNSACTDDRDTFLFANMNLLTDQECETLFKHEGAYLLWNKEYEICVGKKHQFPKHMISFRRKRKRKAKKKEEEKQAKEEGLPAGYEPTRFRYVVSKKLKQVSLGTPNKYEYDWFLGGVDTCQGDSGGPLWRNLKDGDKVRATQIGVVSRGRGCAKFNSPAIFGSVRKVYKWIKDTVEEEMEEKNYCPPKN